MSDEMKRELESLKAGQQFLKADVHSLKTDVHSLKTDVHALKTDVRSLKTGQRSLKAGMDRIEGVVRRMAAHMSILIGDVADLKKAVPPMQRDITIMKAALESLVPEVEASRRERFIASDASMGHERRLDDHERRLSRLETKRA